MLVTVISTNKDDVLELVTNLRQCFAKSWHVYWKVSCASSAFTSILSIEIEVWSYPWRLVCTCIHLLETLLIY